MIARRTGIAAAFLAALAMTQDASAAGLSLADRGVRPMGRGGAFVAGADDLGAIWYNPAGLADAGTSILVDFSYLHFTSDFTRRSLYDDGTGTLRQYDYPTVSGTSPFLPIPTIAGSYAFKDPKGLVVAAGMFAPSAVVSDYPMAVNGQPASSRYSLVSLDGSLLVVPGVWVAYKPTDAIRFGAGIEALVGTFKSQVTFSASPADRLIGPSESANYDALSQLTVGPIFAPSANFGVTVKPHERVRIGLSGQLPFRVDAPAKIDVRLPNAVEFDNAHQQGDEGRVHFDFPAILRVGVEVRPIDKLRVEATYVREFWSIHESIDVTPGNIQMVGILGFPSPFAVAPITIPRHFQDTSSVRVGGEYALDVGKYQLDLRAGVNWEESASPAPYLSVLTLDLTKVTASTGVGFHLNEHWRFDALYAHVFESDTTVTPQEAAVPRVNPVKGNATPLQAVNGGTYSARADILGLGLNYRF